MNDCASSAHICDFFIKTSTPLCPRRESRIHDELEASAGKAVESMSSVEHMRCMLPSVSQFSHSHAGVIVPCASFQYGAQTSVHNCTLMLVFFGLMVTVSKTSVCGSTADVSS